MVHKWPGEGTAIDKSEFGIIDPRFVQVTIDRWQNYTGQQAERVR